MADNSAIEWTTSTWSSVTRRTKMSASFKLDSAKDHIRHVRSTFMNLHNEIKHIERVQKVLDPIRRQYEIISRAVELSRIASMNIEKAMKTRHMIDQATGLAATAALESIADRLAISERLFSGVDLDSIYRSIAVPEIRFLRLQDSINDMNAIYGKLAESIHRYPEITHLPRFVLPGATREVFVTGYATNVLGVSDEADAEQDDSLEIQSVVDEVEEETSICASLLKGVDPALARPYEGARDVLYGTNPDRARHFLSSQRELWNHLLRIIAPDEQVQEWIPKDGKDLLHEGKPTRKARILYLCRDLNHDSLTEFVVRDTHALVTLVNLFNRVHQLEPKLSDQQLRALQLRSDSWLTYILQIFKESQ